jgi:parvulin-like peptidyl-prolyl isomerase
MRRERLFILLCALAAVVSIALAGCGGGSGGGASSTTEGRVGDLPAGVVAQVGDQRITTAQLDRALEQQLAQLAIQKKPVPKQGTKEYDETRKSALEGLVAQRIYAIEAAKCGTPCRVTQAQIDKQLDMVKRTSFSNSQAQFDQFLKRSKFTLADASALIRAQLQRQKIFASLTKPIRYTPAEAQKYYRENISQYKNPELRQARHILVPTKALADRIRAQVNDSNFAALAKRYSTDPGSKAQGGDLGTIFPGTDLVPEFQKALNSLKVGQISQPVQTQFGWHIIEVTKITPPGTLSFAKVRSSIIQTQLQLKRQAALAKWQTDVFQGWRKKTVYADESLLPAPAAAAATGVTVTAGQTTP